MRLGRHTLPKLIAIFCCLLILATTNPFTSQGAQSGTQWCAYGPVSTKQIMYQGKVVYRIPGVWHDNTTYMPVWYVMQVLTQAGVKNNWTGQEWDISSNGGPLQTVHFVPRPKNIRAIVVDGHIVYKVSSFVYQNTTYMPIWYVMNVLRKIGYTTGWYNPTWKISKPIVQPNSTSGSAADRPIVMGFMTCYGSTTIGLADVQAHSALVQDVATFSHFIKSDGTIQGGIQTDAVAYAHSSNTAAFATVANLNDSGAFDGKMVDSILHSQADAARLQTNITNLVVDNGFTGANVDFEEIPPADQALFSGFLRGLHNQLSSKGKQLMVDVPAETGNFALESYDGAYDYKSIGQAVDLVMVMAYDYSYPGGPAGAIAPIWWVDKVLSYTTSVIPAKHILMGVPAYAYDWVGTKTQAMSMTKVENLIQTQHATTQWDSTDNAPYFTYTDSDGTHTVYYEDQRSLKSKFELAQKYKVLGAALWRIGLEDTATWSLVSQYENPTTAQP